MMHACRHAFHAPRTRGAPTSAAPSPLPPLQTILSSSADKTTRIWSETSPGAFTCAATLTDHSAEVVGVTVHPSRKYFVTGSADGSWCFYDLDKAECLRQVRGG